MKSTKTKPYQSNKAKHADLIKKLGKITGERWVSADVGIADTYAWQMNAEILTGSHFMPRAIANVLPRTTQQVSEIMKLCHKSGIQCKPMGSGQGPWNAPRKENNSILIDLRRMDSIIKIDKQNMYAVVETYVTNNQLQTEAMKLGLNCHIIGAGGQASQLAAATSFNGHGPDGISNGFAGRNLLGFEWVLPNGEIVRTGSFDSSGEYFAGDGMGPSLRGVIRGFAGAMGGLGIFTKAAVQLFPWDGPECIEVIGKVPYQMTDIPKNHMSGIFAVPGWKEIADLGYDLGEAGIANYILRNSPSLTIPVMYSTGAESIKGLKIPMFTALDHVLYIVMTAAHKQEYRYKKKVLLELAKKLNGGFLGSDGGLTGLSNKLRFFAVMKKRVGISGLIKSIPGLVGLVIKYVKVIGIGVLKKGNPLNSIMYGKFVRADSNVKATIALGGNFSTSLGTISPWDMAVRSAQVGINVKKRFIRKKEIVDDNGDGGHGGLYEGGSYSHIETVALYDPNDEKQVSAQERFIEETNKASIDNTLGISINSFGPAGSDTFSPHAMNYDSYIQKIKRMIDPENTSDAGWYTDPDYRPPEKIKKIKQNLSNEKLNFEENLVRSENSHTDDIKSDWITLRGYQDIESII